MNSYSHKTKHNSDFRSKSTFGVALIALLFIAPLAINHFIQNRLLLGFGSLTIVVLLSVIAWKSYKGHYDPRITFIAYVPVTIFFLTFSLQKLTIITAFWCYPAVLSFYFMLPERQAWLANILLLIFVLPQGWSLLELPVAIRFVVTLLTISTFSAIFIRMITQQQQKLETQVVTDPLTGLLNRTLLNETLEQAVKDHNRNVRPMTLLSLDLDHFKMVNDNLGHSAGDKVLSSIGDLLLKRMRQTDKVFRLGGEEFLALLYNTETEMGKQLAEELRGSIESLDILPDHPITVSIGIATLKIDEGWDEWMQRCDENLYRAKLNGRNMVVSVD